MNKFYFVITEDLEEERLDKCLNLLMEDLSRSYLQKLLSSGNITVNGKQMKSSYRVKTDDQIQLILPPVSLPDITPENIPLEVLYEDKSVIVVNKPKGMVVHPAPGHYSGTLVNALLFHCSGELSGINGILRPGIVHRIDRDTTGSVIACKNDKAHACIAEQLKQHTIVRRYHAIVHGRLKEEQGTIHTKIGRHPTDRKRMSVLTNGGKDAITHYKVLRQLGNYSYIECKLETGRTHQIRVHMAHLGHPLLGDAVYGPKNRPFHLEGQTLHAKILGFSHPETGAYIETDAPLPQYFQDLLSKFCNSE
ncbi:RluA family pseudouridine synthase [Parablautia muri]|uniref:Pseudouridine synthase n=1 Tax=Parablautia muri TaxID=2320879 RepID=A0A9X5GRU5_9FIRM|nr:RluA family pseudouridine synthase [Parablautia muri]